jgi:hypothetical protein
MDAGRTYSEDFIKALDTLKIDTNRALIYSVRIVSSKDIDAGRKNSYSVDIGNLGSALSNAIQRFDLASVTDYNLRDREKAFTLAAEGIHKEFERLFAQVDRKYNFVIDKQTLFKISDIVQDLRGGYRAEYLISADKIEKLLSIKTLIIQIYESQVKKAVENEKNMDKQFVDLKEKTFLQMLHEGSNRNPVYLLKTCELIRKYVSQDVKTAIVEEGATRTRQRIEFWGNEGSGLGLGYAADGLGLSMRIAKTGEGSGLRYEIAGFIEKGSARVDYAVTERVPYDRELVFERVSGLDSILEQYEKAVLEARNREKDGRAKAEDLNKGLVDKAIDDILFG